MNSLQPGKYLGFRIITMLNEDSRNVSPCENDDGMIVLNNFVVSLGAYETCRHEVPKLTVL